MKNAKDEFIETIKDYKVLWAYIERRDCIDDEITLLKPFYTKEDYEKFLKDINFIYDDGYGSQEVFGVIACDKRIWFDRREYDGSEWWEKHVYPNYYDYLEKKEKKEKEDNENETLL